ncbi:unnamed protein product [Pedinophyceae sp. YPF-701]|nr:unnamed protein product [Pedinophyceae sp. YPF-701]
MGVDVHAGVGAGKPASHPTSAFAPAWARPAAALASAPTPHAQTDHAGAQPSVPAGARVVDAVEAPGQHTLGTDDSEDVEAGSPQACLEMTMMDLVEDIRNHGAAPADPARPAQCAPAASGPLARLADVAGRHASMASTFSASYRQDSAATGGTRPTPASQQAPTEDGAFGSWALGSHDTRSPGTAESGGTPVAPAVAPIAQYATPMRGARAAATGSWCVPTPLTGLHREGGRGPGGAGPGESVVGSQTGSENSTPGSCEMPLASPIETLPRATAADAQRVAEGTAPRAGCAGVADGGSCDTPPLGSGQGSQSNESPDMGAWARASGAWDAEPPSSAAMFAAGSKGGLAGARRAAPLAGSSETNIRAGSLGRSADSGAGEPGGAGSGMRQPHFSPFA